MENGEWTMNLQPFSIINYSLSLRCPVSEQWRNRYDFPEMSTFLNPTFIISVLVAISVHEWAHGMAAHRLGDPTAEHAGRLTLNPLAHLDPLGALLFLTVGFGWSKPVPVNPLYFRRPRRDIALVSIAGPASNFCLALLAFLGIALLSHHGVSLASDLLSPSADGTVLDRFLLSLLGSSLFINLGLMAFNLLPVAPLDGSKILQSFMPLRFEEQYEQFMRMGPLILIFLFVGESLFNLSILSTWIFGIANAVLNFFSLIFAGIIR